MTFVLIVSVACVWGIIFYKVFNAAGAEDDYTFRTPERPAKYEPLDDYIVHDTSKLSLNYNDPFLKGISDTVTEKAIKPAVEISTNPIIKPVQPVIQKPVVNWSAIKYNGFIVNPERKSIVCILSVNGKEYMLSEGEGADGVKLLKSGKDSIKVLYQQNTRFIKLQI